MGSSVPGLGYPNMGSPVTALGYLACRRFSSHMVFGFQNLDKEKYQEFETVWKDYQDKKLISFTEMRQATTKILKELNPDLEREFRTVLPLYKGYREYALQTVQGEGKLLREVSRLLKEVSLGRLNIKGYRERVALIFKGHPDLIDELQRYVLIEAMEYARMVKEHFATRNEGSKYEKFVRLLDGLHTQRGEFSSVRWHLVELFQNDPDLIRGLNIFLPIHDRIAYPGDGDAQVAVGDTFGTDGPRELPSAGDEKTLGEEVISLATVLWYQDDEIAIYGDLWYENVGTEALMRRKVIP
ncbi:hypothetical protein R1flu_003520 [Riccia fluitans]|uniref:Uncharacterized protein n=1 Tax=Riccia fluitans TaxID=41844 RepID=A0ABD1Y9U1_9MARC